MRSLLFAAALFAAPALAVAAPHGTRLTYDGDPARTIAVSWNSDLAGDDQIQYGTSPSSLTMTATAVHTAQPSPLLHTFTAHLTGLAPATTYYYRVGGAGGAYHPSGGQFSFRTRSDDPCEPFEFVLIGDNRADFDGMGANPLWADILDEAMAHSPDLFVNTGDMVKNGNDPAEWISFIDESEPGWANVPSILTMGNHDQDDVDGDGALYNQLYAHPRNSATGTEDYYSVDVGPIHFVSLNSQFNDPSTTEQRDMVAWLASDLAATTQPWKIVFFHKAVYSRGNHHTGEEDNDAGWINAALIPLFDEHDVDLVFNGHSHDYERYAPSVGVDAEFGGTGRTFPAGPGSTFSAGGPIPDGDVGTTYIVSGGAGALTTDIFGFTCIDASCTYCLPFGNTMCPDEVYDNDVAATVVYDGRHNYAVFSVAGDVITAQVWSTVAGNSGGAEMIDAFSITKTPFPVMCGSPPPIDAGVATPDAAVPPGNPDAGVVGPGDPDAGGPGAGSPSSGCGCRMGEAAGDSPALPFALLALCALAVIRRRG